MDQDWKVVLTVKELHLSEMAKQMLNDNNIEAIIMNKVDSAYPSIGHVEVLVKGDDQEDAELLLREFKI
jgi:hypothetical protein